MTAQTVYYNEIDAYCAKWLRNLMDAGHIPVGDIDTRSIEDVRPDELRGYTQCHFFAGLGGWSYALQLAGWGNRPVWTGSCPCQPFSAAGKRAGFADERHLWPSWQHLIAQRRPSVVFGEQVASATDWLGLVCGDLENLDYAVGHMLVEAASAGADHRRDRLWFVADSRKQGLAKRVSEPEVLRAMGGKSEGQDTADDGCTVEHANGITGGQGRPFDHWSNQGSNAQKPPGLSSPSRSSWIIGHDGKARHIEPSICLLADGVPARVGKLRALGNAIDPRPAAAFVTAYMQARGLITDRQAVTA